MHEPLYSSRNLKFFNIASVFLANIISCRASTDNVITRISADLTLTSITYSNSLTYMARLTKIHFWNEIPLHIVKHTLIYWNISYVIILSSSTFFDFQWNFTSINYDNQFYWPVIFCCASKSFCLERCDAAALILCPVVFISVLYSFHDLYVTLWALKYDFFHAVYK